MLIDVTISTPAPKHDGSTTSFILLFDLFFFFYTNFEEVVEHTQTNKYCMKEKIEGSCFQLLRSSGRTRDTSATCRSSSRFDHRIVSHSREKTHNKKSSKPVFHFRLVLPIFSFKRMETVRKQEARTIGISFLFLFLSIF